MPHKIKGLVTFVVLASVTIVHCHDPTIYMKQTFPYTTRVNNYNTLVVEKDTDCLLACVVDKKPPRSPLQWVVQMLDKNITIPISTDTDTQNSFKYQLDKPATNIWRLKIQNTQVSDEGLYICRVQLHNFQFANVSRMIKVIQPPQIIDIYTSSNMLKQEGDQVELRCEAQGIPTPLISWVRSGGGILPSGGRELVSNRILVDKVDRSHKGTYKCIAQNTAGKDVRLIKLDVKFAPRLLAKEQQLYQAVGYNRELKCEVSGNPAPTQAEIVWYRNGGELTDPDKYEIESFSGSNYVLMKLRVKDITDSDYGKYNCFAENSEGSGESYVTLIKSDEYVSDRRTNDSSHIQYSSLMIIFLTVLACLYLYINLE